MIETQNKEFEMRQTDTEELFNILKPELAKAFGEQLEGYVDENSLELVQRDAWSIREGDGRTYIAKHLRIMLHKGHNVMYKYFFVVKLTPFNCYFCDQCSNLKSIAQPDKYLDKRSKALTTFYRRQMQNLYGKDWRDTFDSYINRVKKYRQNLLDDAYNESMQEIERDIAEEQTF